MDDDIDRERERRALFAEFERDGDLVAERSERNSWIHEWRRVITSDEVDQSRLILLEEGHCLRDQALAFCSTVQHDMPLGLGATSLATIMQMVANGYGVTLLPEIAADAEMRDERIKLLRFAASEPSRTIGLAFRRTSPRKEDFVELGRLVVEASPAANQPRLARQPRLVKEGRRKMLG